MKRILFIGPLPPPIDGQSKATAAGLDAINNFCTSIIINLNRSSLKRNIYLQFLRVFEILFVFIKVIICRFRVNLIYFSISESRLGNLKDLFIYFLLFGKLSHLTIHMLGGSGLKVIFEKKDLLYKINKFFLSRISGVIVEGEFGREIFSEFFTKEKIFIVNNFSDEYLFASDKEIDDKFNSINKIKILYLSNMIQEKGYHELAQAFINLPLDVKKYYSISFVGGFPNDYDKSQFLSLISNQVDINYLGSFIDGYDKKKLYLDSHIFCLPTYYPYEGQPISILEAYATGCVVITTLHAGIPDIFNPIDNGFNVDKKSINSIKNTLIRIVENRDKLKIIAKNNLYISKHKFRIGRYKNQFLNVFIH